MPALSIIVPVYNVESYLPRCIDSILAQSYRDFELILIDDGSTDACGSICDSCAEKDSRITVIHQQNAGLSGARNAGLQHAHGKYIAFIDSDDYISTQMFGTMLAAAEKNQADVVCCGRQYDYGSHVVDRTPHGIPERISREAFAGYVLRGPFAWNVWDKIYRAECLTRPFEPVKMSEDIVFLFANLTNFSRIVYVEQPFYTWIIRGNSLSHSDNSRARMDSLYALEKAVSYAEGLSPEIHAAAEAVYVSSGLYYVREYRGRIKAGDTGYSEMRRSVRTYIKKHFSAVLQNKQITFITKARAVQLLIVEKNA